MKKKIFILIFLLTAAGFMFLLLIFGGTKTVNDLKGVTVEIKEGTLSSTGLTLIIKNESEYVSCTFGEPYNIEKKIAGGWYQISVKGRGWHDIGYPVSRNESREFEINWESSYGELKAGEYRIIKNFSVTVDYYGNVLKNDNNETIKYYAAAEFTVK